MTQPTLQQPIILLGTHRSGTTFLGSVLQQHPDVAYWEEPRHVWVWHNANTPDDHLSANHARPEVINHIHRAFRDHIHEQNKPRFAEKTPSNCLRLDFINAVFPDARYIHIYRDGRAVVRSTLEMLASSSPDTSQVINKLKQTPLRDWPSFASRAWHTLAKRLLGKPMSFWGPRPPGWKDWVAKHPPHVVLAKQWVHSVEAPLAFKSQIPSDRWIDLRYEELVQKPSLLVAQALQTANLPPSLSVDEFVTSRADASRKDKWRDELAPTTLDDLKPAMLPTLQKLGYDW